mgnify:CR=1 FL=1
MIFLQRTFTSLVHAHAGRTQGAAVGQIFRYAPNLPQSAALYADGICIVSYNKDLKSKPKKNRFFPLRFGDAVRAVKDLNLKQYDDSRLAVRMENIEGEFKNGFPLFDLVPEEELAIFSLSENLSTKPIHKAIMLALSKASKLKVKPKDHIHNSYFSAYFNSDNQVVIVRVDLTCKLKRYRADDKLKNARYVGSSCKEVVLESFCA